MTTKEKRTYILENIGIRSFAHFKDYLNYSDEQIQFELKKDSRKYKRAANKRHWSEEVTNEIVEYYSTHSDPDTLDHFCKSSSKLYEILEEKGIQKHTRSEALRLTHIKNYGSQEAYVESMNSNIVRTCQDRYGVNNGAQTNSAKQKQVKTFQDHYGVNNPMQSSVVKKRFQETMLNKRNVNWAQQDESVLAKRIETCNEKNGGCGWASPSVYSKFVETMRRKYGSECTQKIPELQHKTNKTCQEKYGVDWPCMTKSCREKSSNDSRPNLAFAELLKRNGIQFEREFGIESFSYDFKVGNVLIEIDPAPTHNSTWECFRGNKLLPKNYHYNKSRLAEKYGYRCIHVWDWDDVNKVVSIIQTRPRVFARKCIVKEISLLQARDFLNRYHFQGFARCKDSIGLFYQDNLVSVMTFGTPRYNNQCEFELVRYCSIYQVVGGAEKLFSFFVSTFNPCSIVSYCDMSKFEGKTYQQLGFQFSSCGISGHWYNIETKKHITFNLLRQRGFDQLLGKTYGYYGKGTNNDELMKQHGFVAIYDAGQATYTWINKEKQVDLFQ